MNKNRDIIVLPEEEKNTLGRDYGIALPKEKNTEVITAFTKDEDEYVIVKEFSGGSHYTVNIGSSAHASNRKKSPNDPTSKYVYAEKIYDDELDFLTQDYYTETTVVKKVILDFAKLVTDMDDAMASYGADIQCSTDVISAMLYSRLIHVDYKQMDDMKKFYSSLHLNQYFINYAQADKIQNTNVFAAAMQEAKENKDRPVFVYVKDVVSENSLEFFRAVLPYIANPDGNSYIAFGKKSDLVPKNLYVLYSLDKDQTIFDMPRAILHYSAYFKMSFGGLEIGKPHYVELSLSSINEALKDYSPKYMLREDTWKSIDAFLDALQDITGYTLTNKVVRQLERCSCFVLATGVDDDKMIDKLFSSTILTEAIYRPDPSIYLNEFDLNQLLDNSFGTEKMVLSKKFVDYYLKHYDMEGNRIL